MGLSNEHEMHRRRRSRNIGVAVTLVAFVALVLGLTMVKVTRGDFEKRPPQAEVSNGN
ncbi:hypothetical protein [Tropicibacter alexandrii]|uniref:hypothetical protein n=1 Tax=Tropicibacter alexandrii TaxID=2267683 RepID=UPI0013E8E4DA|nr:hypothetical protein [Tropicibacter alexandrii]